MSKSRSVKKQSLLGNKICNNCFNPTHIKFNFSFITYDDNFTEEYQIQFLKRIRELSSVSYLEMLSWDKKKGIEIEKIDIKKKISPLFFDGNTHRNFESGKYAIFRLYKKDEPILARVIGCLINKVFYIFFIDIGGKLYSHSN